MFKTTDGGSVWQQIDSYFEDGYALIIDPKNKNNIYAGGSCYNGSQAVMAVAITNNAGTSWIRRQLTSTYGETYMIAIDPINSNIVFAGGLNNDSSKYIGKLFRTTDGGNNWTDVSTGISDNYNYVYSLAFDPVNPNKILAGCGQGIYQSTNGGSNWTKLPSAIYYARSIIFDPNMAGTLYAASSYYGVYMSSDNGKTWSALNNGLTTNQIRCMVADMSNKILYAGSDGFGMFRMGISPPKVMSPISDKILLEDFGTIEIANLDTVFFDRDGDQLIYSASSRFNKVKVGLSGNLLSLISTPNFSGADTVTVNALDPTLNVTVSDKFTVLVTAVNDPPVLSSIVDISFPEDDSTTLDLDNFVTDVDNTPTEITFVAEVIAASSMPFLNHAKAKNIVDIANSVIDPDDLQISIDPTTHVATFKTTVDSSGIFTVVFTAADLGDLFDQDTIQVTVAPINDPPQLSTPPELVFKEDDSLKCATRQWYDYIADVETADSALYYQVISGSYVTACDQDSCFIFFAPANWFGRDTLQLIVTDGFAADTADQMIEVIAVNDPPIFIELPDTIRFHNDLSAEFNIWNCVHDEESPAAKLSYTFTPDKDSLSVDYNSSTGTVTLTAPNFVGMVKLLVKASDDSNATAKGMIVVAVEYPTSVNWTAKELPQEFKLDQNYPNPFNMETTIEYQLPHSCYVELTIFNLLGQQVKALIAQPRNAGYFKVAWNGTDNSGNNVNSGIYVVTLHAGDFVQGMKIIVLK